MWEKWVAWVVENHLGKAIGLAFGIIAGVLIISFGFWKALFFMFCIAMGFAVGKVMDDNGSLSEWIDKFRGR
ncbi:MAG: DUF2273 domain-containing protein [Solirubrobacterales bacterium]